MALFTVILTIMPSKSGKFVLDHEDVSVTRTGLDRIKDKCFTLNINDLSYAVTEYQGRWWKGACFRTKKVKQILKNVHMCLKSGEIAAVLGNSGKYACYLHTQ